MSSRAFAAAGSIPVSAVVLSNRNPPAGCSLFGRSLPPHLRPRSHVELRAQINPQDTDPGFMPTVNALNPILSTAPFGSLSISSCPTSQVLRQVESTIFSSQTNAFISQITVSRSLSHPNLTTSKCLSSSPTTRPPYFPEQHSTISRSTAIIPSLQQWSCLFNYPHLRQVRST
jgi:hypothetical protein